MKQQKFFYIILVVCALLTLAGCASTSTFDGSRVKNADSYQLDIKTMNCTDTHTLELKQGDTLKIQFETVKGNLSMKITAPDGTELYQGDGTVKEFTVEAPVGDTCALSNMLLAGIGAVIFIIAGVRWASMQKLLREGEFIIIKVNSDFPSY